MGKGGGKREEGRKPEGEWVSGGVSEWVSGGARREEGGGRRG